MEIPGWWEFVLMTLGAFRVWRLLGVDTVLDLPRRWVTGLGRDWTPDDPVPPSYRWHLAEWVGCPWCLGFWVALAWWGAWLAYPDWAVGLAVPWALSAAVGIVKEAT